VLNKCIIHSKCSEITLHAVQSDEELTIMIEDDGVGFDQEEVQKKRGLGLKSAASRIKMLKGDLLIDSVIGRGTIVTILVPVRYI
jgi:two-component system, NarL family, sensor kinase